MVAPPTHERVTVTEAVTRYTATFDRAVATGSMSRVTASNYTRDLTEFTALAGGDKVLDDLTGDDLDEVMVRYANSPDGRYKNPAGKVRSLGATARFKQSVSRMFTHAERVGWVQLNPVPDMAVTLKGHRSRAESRTALPESSAHALLKVERTTGRADQDLAVRDRFILHVLMEVGPRVSELVKADRADIYDDDHGVTWFRIRHGKGAKERLVAISPATASAFREWEANRPEPKARYRTVDGERVEVDPVDDADRALLLTWRGVRMRARDVQNLVHRYVKGMPANLRRDVTPHGLRHTAATLLLTSGAADVRTVRDILGHASISTTSVYLDTVQAEMVRAVRMHPVTARP